ncbi:MAG: hypothetical protein E7566_08060 [Ruminococcaceae bacterium]|nr:hypothetical protein [Oscillospiraceae bacterium]
MANTEKRGNNPYGDLLKSAKGQNAESLMQRLSPDQREKVKSILSSPEETNKFLSNPKVQELIRKLKNNG